jgi:hypothetical protein
MYARGAASWKNCTEGREGQYRIVGTGQSGEKRTQGNGQRGSKGVTVAPWKSPVMAWSTVCDDYFRVADYTPSDEPIPGL